MEGKVLGTLGAILVGLVIVFIFAYGLLHPTTSIAEETISILRGDEKCPEGFTMQDYLRDMRTYSSSTSPEKDPGEAIEIFFEYLECKNPRKGEPRFTPPELEAHDKEILSCANAAYVAYMEELKTKKQQTKNNEEEQEFYNEEMEKTTKEKNIFFDSKNAIYPPQEFKGVMCNYQATGRG
jgi:hypothetical protein